MKRLFAGMLTALAVAAAGILLSGCLSIDKAADFFPALPLTLRTKAAESVRVDWSQLTPYAPLTSKYAQFDPYSGAGDLIPSENYGTLLPYIGAEVSLSGYVMDAIPLYGLVTADGQIVTDPVYSEILTSYGPFLLLYRSDRDGVSRVTIAARDGSWARDAGDWREFLLLDDPQNPRLAVSHESGAVRVYAPDGSMTAEFSRDDLTPYLGDDYAWGDAMIGYIDACALTYENGYLTAAFFDEDSPWGNYWRYACFMNPNNGSATDTPPAHWRPDSGWNFFNPPEFPGYCYPEEVRDLTSGALYYTAYPDCAELDGDWTLDLLDENGNLLREDCMTSSALQWRPVIADGLLGVVKDGAFSYTDIDTGDVTFRYALRTNSD